ncbi:MAG: hypothetical protein WDZ88_04290 [Candidatus Paceibacterota bacterium]
MKKLTILIWLGIFVVLIPLLGVYSEWKTIAFVVIGALIVILSFSLKNDFEEFYEVENSQDTDTKDTSPEPEEEYEEEKTHLSDDTSSSL